MPFHRKPTLAGPIAALLVFVGTSSPAFAQQPPPAKPAVSTAPPKADITRADYIKIMDGEFRRRDSDGNGTITRAELEKFEQAGALAQARENNRQLFYRLDADRNGSLSPGEFVVLVGAVPFIDVSPQMARLDANRDQQVSLIEYRATTLLQFDRLDTDHDGVVTDAEFKAGNIVPAGR